MEHYLLIGPTDLTATLAPDKEHQWHYAAPGEEPYITLISCESLDPLLR